MKRYSIKVTPKEQHEHLGSFDKCLYGVSVGAINKRTEDLLEGLRWASASFKRCCILLGDSLYRFTLQIQKGVNPEEAERLSLGCGQELLGQIISRLTRLPEIIRCSDILATPRFAEYLEEIEVLHSRNSSFSNSIANDALLFVERQANKGRLAISKESAIELAIFYLLEEVAIYGCLAEQGWLVDVYQGEELPTLAKIICGEIPGFEGPLTKRINISLRLR